MKKLIVIVLFILSACSSRIYHFEITQYDGGKIVNFWDRYGVVDAVQYEFNNASFYDRDTLVVLYGNFVVKRNFIYNKEIANSKRDDIKSVGDYFKNCLVK